MGSRNSIYPSLSGQNSACVNDIFKCCGSHQEINKKIFQEYNFLTLQFVVKLSNTRIYVTALFDDKVTFIDSSKTPIFEWEVAIILFILV